MNFFNCIPILLMFLASPWGDIEGYGASYPLCRRAAIGDTICLRKLHDSIGFDIVERRRRLQAFYSKGRVFAGIGLYPEPSGIHSGRG